MLYLTISPNLAKISRVYLGVLLMLFGVCQVWAAPDQLMERPKPKNTVVTDPGRIPGIDTNQVRKLYMDGDFDPAIDILEAELKTDKHLNHPDSVFIYKHLGVMYAAKYETRERGKMYMFQLLLTEPTAKIMDMYASDMIYMIFKNIQDEFETNRARLARAKGHVDGNGKTEGSALSDTTSAKRDDTSKNRHLGMWIGAAAVVVGVGTYFLIAGHASSSSSTHSF